ncbi:hypothetical protein [Marinomonas sp.]
MTISNVTNHSWHQMLPTPSVAVENNSAQNQQAYKESDSIQLSDYAKSLLDNANSQSSSSQQEEQEAPHNESIQVSSSVGRSSRINGLSREEAVDLYRSIERLS